MEADLEESVMCIVASNPAIDYTHCSLIQSGGYMSINPISSADLTAAYEAFNELMPHMSDIRKIAEIDFFDEAYCEALGIRILPILQNALDKVEDVLRKRGFFTEDFDLAIARYQEDCSKIADLEGKIQYIKQEPTSLADKLSEQYNQTKTFGSSNIVGSYLSSSSESKLEGDLEFMGLLGNVSKAFDRVISASIERDDEEFIRSMENFAHSYKVIIDFTSESQALECIQSLELELIEVEQRMRLDLKQPGIDLD